jgi:hypothetical protein
MYNDILHTSSKLIPTKHKNDIQHIVMFSVVTLNVVFPSVIMPGVARLTVVAPINAFDQSDILMEDLPFIKRNTRWSPFEAQKAKLKED